MKYITFTCPGQLFDATDAGKKSKNCFSELSRDKFLDWRHVVQNVTFDVLPSEMSVKQKSAFLTRAVLINVSSFLSCLKRLKVREKCAYNLA